MTRAGTPAGGGAFRFTGQIAGPALFAKTSTKRGSQSLQLIFELLRAFFGELHAVFTFRQLLERLLGLQLGGFHGVVELSSRFPLLGLGFGARDLRVLQQSLRDL